MMVLPQRRTAHLPPTNDHRARQTVQAILELVGTKNGGTGLAFLPTLTAATIGAADDVHLPDHFFLKGTDSCGEVDVPERSPS